MSATTTIEWTRGDDGTAGTTWNPVTGCDEVSEGCDRCYAKTFAERWRGIPGHPFEHGFDVTLRPERLDQPLRWRKPRRVFVNSMSDLFHEQVPDEFIARVFAVMAATPQHTYQILTKRHGRMRSLLGDECRCGAGHAPGGHFRSMMEWAATPHSPTHVPGLEPGLYHRAVWPLPNVWLGVSVETQRWADVRIPALLDTPAAVRFLSCEPLLGPVDLTAVHTRRGQRLDVLAGDVLDPRDSVVYAACPSAIDWVITGGESGHGARPLHPQWVRDLRDQCVRSNRAYFFKQRGHWSWDRPEGAKPVPDAYVSAVDGRVADQPTALADPDGAWAGVWRVGKGKAGRNLDDRTWDQFPEEVQG